MARGGVRQLKWGAGLGYALVVATLVVPSSLALYAAFRAAEARDHVSSSYAFDAARAERLRSLGFELGLDVRAFLIRPAAAAAASFRDTQGEFDATARTLLANADSEGRTDFAGIERAAEDYERAAERVMRSPGARDRSFEEELAPRMKAFQEALDRYVAYKRDLIAPARAGADAKFSRALRVSSAAFVVAILLSALLAGLSARRLERDYRRERQTAARAERALAARDELLAIVAHDLRSPLSAITLKAGLLRKNPQGENQLKQVESIEQIALRMEYLVRMLLDAASMEAGRFSVALGDCQAISILRETVDLFASQADAKAVRLQAVVEGETSDLSVRADRERVIQALSNLIDNAIKFSPPEGHVTVALHPEEGEVVFSVKDEGPGIAAGHLPHVFDRFWKAEQGGKRGTGLGLYIVKGIVEAHGGRIWAESVQGQGGRFSFALPRVPATNELVQRPPSHEGAHAAT